jgi:hypothetical protein
MTSPKNLIFPFMLTSSSKIIRDGKRLRNSPPYASSIGRQTSAVKSVGGHVAL